MAIGCSRIGLSCPTSGTTVHCGRAHGCPISLAKGAQQTDPGLTITGNLKGMPGNSCPPIEKNSHPRQRLEEIEMSIPGFTAEATLYNSTIYYHSNSSV